jgi:L-threonylcarbamoyladenylate synthase
MLLKHYSPRAKLLVRSWQSNEDLLSQLHRLEFALDRTHIIAHTRIPSGQGMGGVSVIPHDPEAFARALYAELHRCDDQGAQLIIVESLPDTLEWYAIADRLRRAAD